MFRNIYAILVFLVLASLSASAYGQSAQIQGQVVDASGAGIPKALVRVVDQQTSTERKTETNGAGQYIAPGLIPSSYKIIVEAPGFSTAISNLITLNVAQNAVLDFKLTIGAASSEVVVTADNLGVNTTDGSVSTVIDRQFVENLPLNGRSFQSLLYLSPGVTQNVTSSNNSLSQGQFVVNGQRGDANYWMVDGVSANVGMSLNIPGASLSGAVGGGNVLGGTSALVSVDALQEFRIETSTFSPEFGRLPGGQISIQTRSGTNKFHGTLFDFLRNADLDATDWFAKHNGLPKAGEIQNDFGGVLGGPIIKDKTFFFFSAEGLRVTQPQTYVGTVPDLAARAAAVSTMRPYFNAYPVPTPGAVDTSLDSGIVPYSASYSNPARADAYSLRVDHQLLKRLNIFARYSHAPSQLTQRGSGSNTPNIFANIKSVTKTATVGATWAKSAQIANELRYNYSVAGGTNSFGSDNFGGGTAFPSTDIFANGLSFANAGNRKPPQAGLSVCSRPGVRDSTIHGGAFGQYGQRAGPLPAATSPIMKSEVLIGRWRIRTS